MALSPCHARDNARTHAQERLMESEKTKNAKSDLDEAALFFHKYPTPGKLEIQATKPLGNQRDLALAYSPGVAAPCLAIRDDPATAADYTSRANLVARHLQWQCRARPRQYRAACLQAGDGRQGGTVQEVRRHRRLRYRDRRAGNRADGRDCGGTGADLRWHQSRGHQGSGMFRGGGTFEGPHGHPGVP